jgi:hypothetical protein
VDLTQAVVRELLDYDPEKGVLTWRVRDREWFKDDGKWKMWNKRFVGTSPTAIYQGYRRIVLLGQHYQAHRIIWLWMTGAWPGEIDHVNHDRADNRWVNLRDAGRVANRKNLSQYANNTSGICGVYARAGRWRAYIRVDGVLRNLGSFGDREAAGAARKAAEASHAFHENHGKAA